MINIQATNVPISISADLGVTWKTIVCISDHTLPLQVAANKVNTQCGTAVGTGVPEFNPTGSGVTNIEAKAGIVSTKQMADYLLQGTALKYRMATPFADGPNGSMGSTFYLAGDCLLTNFTITETVGDVEKFTFTLSGVGVPTTVVGAF